jgi:hypothetical protein
MAIQYGPLLGLAWRRNQQIKSLLESGHSSDKSQHVLVDLLAANAPVLKKYFPTLNEKGNWDKGLLDDIIDSLREALIPPPTGT